MKKMLILLCTAGISALLSASELLPPVKLANPSYLVKDGITEARIYLPEQAGRPLIFAAQELKEHLKKITGGTVEYAWRAPQKYDIGFEFQVRNPQEWKGKEDPQAFLLEEVKSPRPKVIIKGNTELAVLYGVYEYLDGLGVRWFTPGDDGMKYPEGADLAVNPGVKKVTPAFEYRCLDFSGIGDSDFGDTSDPAHYRNVIHYQYDLWLLRNHLNFDRSVHNGHLFGFNRITESGGHSLRSKAGLTKELFEKEPERFPIVTVDFQKKRIRGGQICFTHPKNIETAIRNGIEHFKKQAQSKNDLNDVSDAMDMSLADGSGICECPNCEKAAGPEPYSKDRLVWGYMNAVARGIAKEFPGKKIQLFAPYFELTRPPEGMKIEPNIVAVSCRSIAWENTPENQKSYPFRKAYRDWVEATAKAGAQMASYDYAIWGWSGCSPQPLDLLDAVKAYRDLGYKRYHVEVMNHSQQLNPVLWAMARSLWDKNKNPRDEFAAFCREYYGKTVGDRVLKLYEEMDANARRTPRRGYGSLADLNGMMTPEFIKKYRPQVNYLPNLATGIERKRMEKLAKNLEFMFLTAEAWRAKCDAVNAPTKENIKKFNHALNKAENYWLSRNLAAICAPANFRTIQDMRNTEFHAKPAGRKELADPARWRNELFAGTKVQNVRNLFKLPEFWKFRIDPLEQGLREGWKKENFDDSQWREASTYDFIESQGAGVVDGRFYYRVRFNAPKFPAGKKVYLRIGSVDDTGEVFLNGTFVGAQDNVDHWDKSFEMDVTDALKQGKENTLCVRVYDALGGGGIWRPSALYVK